MKTKPTADLIDLERKIASLSELESEALAEGNESLATVWRKRMEKAESFRDMLKRGAA